MRAIIQRVTSASVSIEGKIIASIESGLLVFLGIEERDGEEDIDWLTGKISRLRLFPDATGVMNCSIEEAKGELLVVSQFTLHASTKKGNRPSYIRAARPELAIPLYNQFVKRMESQTGKPVQTGNFGAMMDVSLVNNGPVTIFIDTKSRE